MPSVSVVIPVFRSADVLPDLHKRLVAAMVNVGQNFDIIFVEDCGGDRSWDTIQELARQDSRVVGIRLSRNFGQHNALLCGMRAASGDVIVTLDDDLQNPPEEIPKLLAKLDEGYDVVYGTPEREQHGFLRDRASQLTKLVLQSSMGAETARSVSAFRAFRTELRDAFSQYRGAFVSIDVLLTWATSRFIAIRVKHDARQVGQSNYTIFRLITHAVNMLTGFSTIPLQLASVVGFVFTLFGLSVLMYVVGRYILQGTSVPGFPFLASVIAIFSGAQLFSIGIIGEYLARMYVRSMERPSYHVRARTEAQTSPTMIGPRGPRQTSLGSLEGGEAPRHDG